MLRVGTYYGPDGVVEVTPDRLKRWERGVQELHALNYAIPSHFGHAKLGDNELLEPIKMSALKQNLDRSAKATVGLCRSFKVAPDGQSAELVLETRTKEAAEKVETNVTFVSPVIHPAWRDGSGKMHHDILTSFDLVDHPVDYSQTSFVKTVRMGRSTQPLSSGIYMPVKKAKSLDTRAREARKHLWAQIQHTLGFKKSLQRLGVDDPDENKPPADDASKGDAADAIDDAGGNAPSDAPPDANKDGAPDVGPAPDVGTGYDKMDQVLDLLSQFGVSLPDDTTDENVIQHLRVALTALLGAPQDGVAEDQSNQMMPGGMNNTPQVSTPMIATMSVQERAQAEYMGSLYAGDINRRLNELFETGRCTPAMRDEQLRKNGPIRLSLDNRGSKVPQPIEAWLEWSEKLPAGTYWDSEMKTKAAQRLSVVQPPEERTVNGTGAGGLSKTDIEAIRALGGKA